MRTINFGLYIIVYNLIIGVLIMIASEKLGVYAGYVSGRYKEPASRLTHTATLTFGACIVFVCGPLYLFFLFVHFFVLDN